MKLVDTDIHPVKKQLKTKLHYNIINLVLHHESFLPTTKFYFFLNVLISSAVLLVTLQIPSRLQTYHCNASNLN